MLLVQATIFETSRLNKKITFEKKCALLMRLWFLRKTANQGKYVFKGTLIQI